MGDNSNNDQWNSDRGRDAPTTRVDPDGVIDSNWHEVREDILIYQRVREKKNIR